MRISETAQGIKKIVSNAKSTKDEQIGTGT